MSNTDQIILDHTAVVGHGNTVAAWACVIAMSVGVLVTTVGFTAGITPMTVVGVGLVAVGIIVGFVLKSMGYGKDGSKTLGH